MLGQSHAIGGALLYAATAPFLPEAVLGAQPRPSEVLVGTLLCAGAALLPDLDHHDATPAHLLGPLSRGLCRLVGRLCGGHRHATHSLLFVALTGWGTRMGVIHLGGGFTLGLTFVLFALAARALHLHPPGHGPTAWITSVGLAGVGTATVAAWFTCIDFWLPYTVCLGTLSHLLGDCLTRRGAPLLWPYRRRFELVLVRRTGGKVESRLLVPLMTVATFAALWFSAFAPRLASG
ncbi:metal-dependent hydrolase [Kitasatospora sp. A2-31]|uniref:metal-dependent hydrolase n=1 Tax=Kitasatospora sp. A2-31 TaxID=2916414 RepID=UPI001EEC1FA5|nr:metal-dependent hydrolase [Kitasatospora sp. A2-31]MCG6498256.1 metal-dependent hydrolase [Kitasatospora sp. A2-31]